LGVVRVEGVGGRERGCRCDAEQACEQETTKHLRSSLVDGSRRRCATCAGAKIIRTHFAIVRGRSPPSVLGACCGMTRGFSVPPGSAVRSRARPVVDDGFAAETKKAPV